MSKSKTNLAFLGCGTLGTAILTGVVEAVSSSSALPPGTPTSFSACVRRPESADRIRKAISSSLAQTTLTVKVHVDDNVSAVEAADMVLLGCKPYMVGALLVQRSIYEALRG